MIPFCFVVLICRYAVLTVADFVSYFNQKLTDMAASMTTFWKTKLQLLKPQKFSSLSETVYQ